MIFVDDYCLAHNIYQYQVLVTKKKILTPQNSLVCCIIHSTMMVLILRAGRAPALTYGNYFLRIFGRIETISLVTRQRPSQYVLYNKSNQ